MPRRSEDFGGVPWTWWESGSGPVALVILPGAVGGADLFFLLFQDLSPGIRVVGIDVPYAPDAASTIAQLDALLGSRGVERAIFLGASYSGLLVQAYARVHPQRSRALILSHTGALDPKRAPQQRVNARRAAKVPAVVLRALLRLLVRLLLRRNTDRRFWIARYDEVLAPLTREAMASRYALAGSIEALPDRPAWTGDVLVIHSDNDAIAKPAEQDRLRAAYPQARWHQFRGTGHSSYSNSPQAYAAVVREFVEGLRS